MLMQLQGFFFATNFFSLTFRYFFPQGTEKLVGNDAHKTIERNLMRPNEL